MHEDLDYSPSYHDRAMKAAFLVAIEHLPPHPSRYSLGEILEICPDLPLTEDIWSRPGYKEWFTNTNEFRELAELAATMGLITCIDVMANPNEKGQAKVTAAKHAAEVADKLPKGKPVSQLPKKIQDMDEEQLKAFIGQAVPHLKPVND